MKPWQGALYGGSAGFFGIALAYFVVTYHHELFYFLDNGGFIVIIVLFAAAWGWSFASALEKEAGR